MEKRGTSRDELLQIFISSTMTDLGPERLAIKEVIEELQLNPVLAEDLGARPEPPREVTLSLVRQCDIYIGLFWERYGMVGSHRLAATEEEYQEALAIGIPILIYIKEPAPDRDRLLTRFLWELEQYDRGHFRATFTTLDELKSQVKRDVMQEVSKLARQKGREQALASAKPEETQSVLQLNGIFRLLRERIMARVTEELDPSVKCYQTMDAVEQGCKALASKVKEDSFIPDIVLGWRDPDRTYRGSETVANLLAHELDVPLRIIEMRETGERREVIEECQWVKGLDKILVVDDACYSGSTLRAIQKKLEVDSTAEFRFAVLRHFQKNNHPKGHGGTDSIRTNHFSKPDRRSNRSSSSSISSGVKRTPVG